MKEIADVVLDREAGAVEVVPARDPKFAVTHNPSAVQGIDLPPKGHSVSLVDPHEQAGVRVNLLMGEMLPGVALVLDRDADSVVGALGVRLVGGVNELRNDSELTNAKMGRHLGLGIMEPRVATGLSTLFDMDDDEARRDVSPRIIFIVRTLPDRVGVASHTRPWVRAPVRREGPPPLTQRPECRSASRQRR